MSNDNGLKQPETVNGINISYQPGAVLVTIGNGVESMTAKMPPDAARKIGMAVLDCTITAAQADGRLVQSASIAIPRLETKSGKGVDG